ncbi:MAG: serine/threonine protein kinase [Nitrosomonas sp.]|nr:MAG: serine/threonine protein kinase [Nitrosomonas sp.]
MTEKFHKQSTLPGTTTKSKDNSDPIPVPKSVGPYVVEGLYREGGMSLLYLTTHPATRDPVIVKVLKPHLRSNPEVVQKFINEAKILQIADHPNIVQLYAYEESEEGPYIALEFIQGQSLHTVIENNPLSLRHSVEFILEIAYALCHLHTLGVIHRDLKPENILVTDQNMIKLIDLGVAQMLSAPHQDPASHHLVGTPIYMSPEQHSDPTSVSYASDIYSLGIIAYELVLGRLSHGQVHLALLPKGLQKIIAKTLQKKIEDRYQDVVDLITDLSAYLNSANLEKERKGADQLSDLSMNLQHARMLLLPNQVPAWPLTDIGVSLYRSAGVSGIYYDFIELPDEQYSIVMAEPSSKGIEGVIHAAMLRGMLLTLCRLTSKPSDLITFLNDIVIHSVLNTTFTLSYILLNPLENSMTAISCGPSNIWISNSTTRQAKKIITENPVTGTPGLIKFNEIKMEWKADDSLHILTGALCSPTIAESAFDESPLIETLCSMTDLPPQKITDAIIRKATSGEHMQLEQNPIGIISAKKRL